MVPQKQRQLVDIAAEVLADERQNIGISYTGFRLQGAPGSPCPTPRSGDPAAPGSFDVP
jgi:hypothetical protein